MLDRITSDEFVRAFREAGRGNQFTVQALRVLFEHLEGLGEDTGSEYLLDVVELCGEYNEATVEELRNEYGVELDEDADPDDAARVLGEETSVAGTTDTTVIFVAY